MKEELLKSFEEMDIVRYKANVVTINNSKRPNILYEVDVLSALLLSQAR